MLYNGIGLLSAKGSSTSGRVEKNLSTLDSTVKNRNSDRHSRAHGKKNHEQETTNVSKYRQQMAKESLKDHKNKRAVEVKCAERRIELEDAGLNEKEIDEHVDSYRVLLSEQYSIPQRSCEVEVTSSTEREEVPEPRDIASTNYVPRHTEGRIKKR